MSRCYHLSLSSSVRASTNLDDASQSSFELLPLADPEALSQALAEALSKAGLRPQPDGTLELEAGEERWTVDLTAQTSTVSLRRDLELSAQVRASGGGETPTSARAQAEANLAEAERAARASLEGKARKLQRQLTQTLQERARARLEQLRRILQEVHAQALERHAASLGEITSIERSESGGALSLRITVREG